MSVLPDELWRRIMEIGVENKILDYKNLCCISITCRRLRRLADDNSLWSHLLISDFPLHRGDVNSARDHSTAQSATAYGRLKDLYKIRYEKDLEQKRLAHRRIILRIESEIAEHVRKIQEMELQSSEEKQKLNKAVVELLNLRRVRQASVALSVWQPEFVRSRQNQMVQQSHIPADSRINALEMEISLCKQQIAGLDKALRVAKRRLDAAKDQLASAKYHPLQELSGRSFLSNEGRGRSKKLKHHSSMISVMEEID